MKKALNRKISAASVILLIITGLWIAFIWFHSAFNAETSGAESNFILDFLNNLLKSLGLSYEFTSHIIRKSAHFCEFAMLGFLSLWTARSFKKCIFKNLMPVGFVCLFTAVSDEYLQLYIPGRAGMVEDVVLDFCGALAGVLFLVLIVAIKSLFKRGK